MLALRLQTTANGGGHGHVTYFLNFRPQWRYAFQILFADYTDEY